MSPRSAEFMAMARDRLVSTRAALGVGSSASATSLAYYAMLYAARAALSEEDRSAKTHTAIWTLFRDAFVVAGRFGVDLFERARKTQPTREAVDYDAYAMPPSEAAKLVVIAEQFVSAIEEMLERPR